MGGIPMNHFYALDEKERIIHRFRFKMERDVHVKYTRGSTAIPAIHPLIRWANRQPKQQWPVKYYE